MLVLFGLKSRKWNKLFLIYFFLLFFFILVFYSKCSCSVYLFHSIMVFYCCVVLLNPNKNQKKKIYKNSAKNPKLMKMTKIYMKFEKKKTKIHTQIATKKRNQSLKNQILLLSLSSPYDTSNNAGLADSSVPQYVHRFVLTSIVVRHGKFESHTYTQTPSNCSQQRQPQPSLVHHLNASIQMENEYTYYTYIHIARSTRVYTKSDGDQNHSHIHKHDTLKTKESERNTNLEITTESCFYKISTLPTFSFYIFFFGFAFFLFIYLFNHFCLPYLSQWWHTQKTTKITTAAQKVNDK